MYTLFRSFKTIFFFAPNRLTLHLMMDEALDSTILKCERSGSAAPFPVVRRQVLPPSASASCLGKFEQSFCSQTQLARRNIEIRHNQPALPN